MTKCLVKSTPALYRAEHCSLNRKDFDMADPREKEATAVGTPRWVKVFGAIALLVLVLVVVLILTGRGGPHSPRRHSAPGAAMPASHKGGHSGPPADVTHASQ